MRRPAAPMCRTRSAVKDCGRRACEHINAARVPFKVRATERGKQVLARYAGSSEPLQPAQRLQTSPRQHAKPASQARDCCDERSTLPYELDALARILRCSSRMMRWAPMLVLLNACASAVTGSSPRYGEQPPPRTVDGEVIRVTSDTAQDGLPSGVRILVRPNSEPPVAVALAPGWYLHEHGVHFEPGDRVRIVGAASGQVFVASDVSKGERTLPLRDALGRPLWSKRRPTSKQR